MPAFPWTQRSAPESGRRYTAMASRLTLKSYTSLPGFLRRTLQIRRQLKSASGLVGYSLRADLRRKTFFTVSVWHDDASLRAFAAADPHASIVRGLRTHMRDTHFEFFALASADLPPAWASVIARVP